MRHLISLIATERCGWSERAIQSKRTRLARPSYWLPAMADEQTTIAVQRYLFDLVRIQGFT